ncbi:MAG: PAS domain-containing protein [Candidatus Binatia bacterium]
MARSIDIFDHADRVLSDKAMQKTVRQDLVGVAAATSVVQGILRHLPCAAAVWPSDQTTGSLNHYAMQLLGVDSRDVGRTTWTSRVDPRDRSRLSAAWERLKNRSESVCSDYRFIRSDGKSIWIRDVSARYHNAYGESEAIISTYTDISDLKKPSSSRQRTSSRQDTLEGIISPLIHEIRNNLHAIRLEIDLLLMDFGATLSSDRFFESIDRVNRSLHDLREYLVCPAPQFSAANPGLILDETLRQMKKELEQQRVHVKFNESGVLPLVSLDSRQFHSALERVIDFCGILLGQGGELAVETGVRKVGAAEYVELTFTTASVSPCELDERDIFRPFLKINNRQIGLGMVAARQLLRRNRATISFAKESSHRGRISILLKCYVEGDGR